MNEFWKDVVGFEGLYQVSNLGRLKSFKSNKSGRVLRNVNKTGGYININLIRKGKFRSVKLHILVAETFLGKKPFKGAEVNHRDLNKQNNCASNLEWVTRSENVAHAIKHHPNMLKGMINYNQNIRPVPILQFDMGLNLIGEYKNSTEAATSTGVCRRNILQVASKDEYMPGLTRKQAGGFIWKFKMGDLA